MAISKKLEKVKKEKINIDELIEKGGSAPKNNNKKHFKICMCIPNKLIDKIELARNNYMLSVTRTKWILDAIVEKLKREEVN